jgi:uncharacterized protein (TIGR02145 family)
MNTDCYHQPILTGSSVKNRRKWALLVSAWLPILFVLCLLGAGCSGDDDSKPVPETGSVTDIAGNVYKTVKIGNQWWMAENLKSTTFTSGEEIPKIEGQTEWASANGPAYSVFNNTAEGVGLLYNFEVITSGKGIAPAGWRVPTDEDWKILEEYLGMPVDQLDETNWRGTTEGDQLKEENTTTSGWVMYDGVWGTNATGFNAIGGSCRVFNGEWGVPGLRHSGYWWSSTAINGYGWFRYLDYQKSGIFRYAAQPTYGFSIRCVKE